MKKRSLLIICIAGFVSISILVSSALAGNVQRNRWEGVAIGIGAAILGKVIWDNAHQGESERVYVQPRRRPRARSYNHYRHRPRPSGHWEIRKVWVPSVYKKVWNPGHYNRRGRWEPGRWIKIEKRPGHWKKSGYGSQRMVIDHTSISLE